MTQITLIKKGREIDFTAKGHCLCGNGGTDIVCAAVSMLSCTLMRHLEGLRPLTSELHISYESGFVSVSLSKKDEFCPPIDECIETLMCGFRMIADSFPENVRVTEISKEAKDENVKKA